METLALFAFGGRASLVVTLFVLAALSIGWLFKVAAGGVHSFGRWAYVLLAAPLLLGCVQALIERGFFDRVLARFSHSAGGAETRSKMFDLFPAFSLESLLLGPDQAILATHQRLEELEFGVESFVVGFILNYGALITVLLLAGLGAFVAALLQVRGRGAIPGLMVFLRSPSPRNRFPRRQPCSASSSPWSCCSSDRSDGRPGENPSKPPARRRRLKVDDLELVAAIERARPFAQGLWRT